MTAEELAEVCCEHSIWPAVVTAVFNYELVLACAMLVWQVAATTLGCHLARLALLLVAGFFVPQCAVLTACELTALAAFLRQSHFA
jgi:hypothetical protein